MSSATASRATSEQEKPPSGPRDTPASLQQSTYAPLLEELLAGTFSLTFVSNLLLCAILPADTMRWLLCMAACAASCAVWYWMARAGYRRLASGCYVGSLVVAFMYLASTSGGTRSPSMFALPVLVLIAGMLLGDLAAFLAAVFSALSALVLAFLEMRGLLPPSSVRHTPLSMWAISAMWTFVLVSLQRLGTYVMRRSLRRAESELAERKRVEAELVSAGENLQYALEIAARSEAEFRTIFESAAVGVVLSDRAGRIVRCNPAFAGFLGYTSEELAGLSRATFVHPDELRATTDFWNALWTAKVSNSQLERRFLRQDGQVVWGRLTASLIGEPGAAETLALGIVEDLTRHRKAEEERSSMEAQFRQAQKMEAVGHLAGGVAHDFNNVLTIINGYAETLLLKLPPHDVSRPMLEQMQRAGERATALTRQLLAFSRKTVVESQVIDVNEVITNLEKMLRRLINEDIRLTILLAPGLGRVRTDPTLLEQAVINLVVNARDAMPNGGRVTIWTVMVELDEAYCSARTDAMPGHYVLLKVSDTGQGMDAHVREHIFEPFFTTKGAGQGTGLGLAMVYGFVKQSGGHITVQSHPGAGSMFQIYLPAVERTSSHRALQLQETGQESGAPKSLSASDGGETILLVEDEDGVRALAKLILEARGYKVLAASGGTEAMDIARRYRQPIHLLLSDVVMPGMTGVEVEKALRPLHPEMKVLFVSGYTDDEVFRHGVLRAEMQFLQKPFSPALLAGKAREVLDNSGR